MTTHIFNAAAQCVGEGRNLAIIFRRAARHGGVKRITVRHTRPDSVFDKALVRVTFADGHYAVTNFASYSHALEWAEERAALSPRISWFAGCEIDAGLEYEILRNMARAFFASAWADMVEEHGRTLRGEILDAMPRRIDSAAWHAARTLAMDMCRANECANLEGVYRLAEARAPGGDRPFTPEFFGHYAAMDAMGHGVGLYDAFRLERDALRVPYCEFGSHALSRDYR